MSINKASIVIPTYGRSSSVVSHTLNSILEKTAECAHLDKIILIDQNATALKLELVNSPFSYRQSISPETENLSSEQGMVLHIHTGPPSVTKAKNKGLKCVDSEYVIFFDDDVTVKPGCIENYITLFKQHPEAGFFAGREILSDKTLTQSSLRKKALRWMLSFFPPKDSEKKYMAQGRFVGRLRPNSFFITNYDAESDGLVEVDVARGCNWAARFNLVKQAGYFDEFYQGTAIREEPDLQMRIGKINPKNYFTSKSLVIHHRQAGGCENLAHSLRVMVSKLDNESYFQKKFFSKTPSIYFLIRLFPMAVEYAQETSGRSFLLLIRYWWQLKA